MSGLIGGFLPRKLQMAFFERLTTPSMTVQSRTCHIARRIVGRMVMYGMVEGIAAQDRVDWIELLEK